VHLAISIKQQYKNLKNNMKIYSDRDLVEAGLTQWMQIYCMKHGSETVRFIVCDSPENENELVVWPNRTLSPDELTAAFDKLSYFRERGWRVWVHGEPF
jgi:hypothetical protein